MTTLTMPHTIELHILQNFAPSNLNRDDTGAPKDAEFGGHRRVRISSQAIKRAIRASMDDVEQGVRTKLLVEQLRDRLQDLTTDAELLGAVVQEFVTEAMTKLDKDGKTDVLLYLGNDEIDRLAGLVRQNWAALSSGTAAQRTAATRNVVKQFKSQTGAVDIALFGRMLASKNRDDMNVDAACQVAHAISTHRASFEFDWFTAVDDLQPKEETGAGMIGTTEFTSACMYRYAVLDYPTLVQNLERGGAATAAPAAAAAFLRAAIAAIPTGKQNTFAAHNPPSLVLAVVRRRRAPWNLANAFAQPVAPSRDRSLIQNSIQQLDAYFGTLARMYADDDIAVRPVLVEDESSLANLGGVHAVPTVEELVRRTLEPFGGA